MRFIFMMLEGYVYFMPWIDSSVLCSCMNILIAHYRTSRFILANNE